jgi:hypothetical protein
MSEREIVFVANDNLFVLSGVALASDGSAINDAVVVMTIKDSSGTDVTGVTWPVVMAFTGTDGQYSATIEEEAGFVDDAGYTAFVDAETPGGITGHWEVPLGAETREC